MAYFFKLIVRNALRHPLRTLLTLIGVVVAIVAFGLLRTTVDAWYAGADAASASRLVVRNKNSLNFYLPYFYLNKIRGIDGVSEVSYADWFGGIYVEKSNFFPQFAVASRSYFKLYPEFVVPPKQMKEFQLDRRGAIVGRKTAAQYGWAKLYGDWGAAEIPKSVYDSIRRSLETDTSPRKKGLPTVRSFILKAYLKDPEQYPLDSREKAAYGVDLLPFIETYPRNENDWKQVNLENRSLRRRAQVLIGKVVQDRNWITPYPIDGLKTLLEKEMLNAPTASEKNWCALQRAIIAVTDERDHKKALSLFSTL